MVITQIDQIDKNPWESSTNLRRDNLYGKSLSFSTYPVNATVITIEIKAQIPNPKFNDVENLAQREFCDFWNNVTSLWTWSFWAKGEHKYLSATF